MDHHRTIRENAEARIVGPVPPEVLAFVNRGGFLPGAALLAVSEAETMPFVVRQGLKPGHEDAALAVGSELRKGRVIRGRGDKISYRAGRRRLRGRDRDAFGRGEQAATQKEQQDAGVLHIWSLLCDPSGLKRTQGEGSR